MKINLIFHARSLIPTTCQSTAPAACLSQRFLFRGAAVPSTSLPKGEIKPEAETETETLTLIGPMLPFPLRLGARREPQPAGASAGVSRAPCKSDFGV